MPFLYYDEAAKRLGQELGLGAMKDRPLEKRGDNEFTATTRRGVEAASGSEQAAASRELASGDTQAEARRTSSTPCQTLPAPKAAHTEGPVSTSPTQTILGRQPSSDRPGDRGPGDGGYEGEIQEGDDRKSRKPPSNRLLELTRRRRPVSVETDA